MVDIQSVITKHHFMVDGNGDPMRLDLALSCYLKDMSREQARRFIQIGSVWINNKRVQVLSKPVFPGDEVVLYRGRAGFKKYYEIDPNNILYQDEHLLFYRKEPGIPTQALICDNYNNLYAALLRYIKANHGIPYLGMHHRLDLETSGVIVFTLSKGINRSIHYQFKDHRVKKSYLALVAGTPQFNTKEFTSYIGRQNGRYVCSLKGPGKIAVCQFTKLIERDKVTLIRAEPQTGRTHQIRLQLAFLGQPVLGDPLYGQGHTEMFTRTMLHAEQLSIIHPIHKKELIIRADLFEDMRRLIGDVSL
ncbi:MAG: RluA family pseudouridine synthase [Proteobacteria bacterium]|nr:RluA family pseudouridine synthase [Pseudomonadota bacterium]